MHWRHLGIQSHAAAPVRSPGTRGASCHHPAPSGLGYSAIASWVCEAFGLAGNHDQHRPTFFVEAKASCWQRRQTSITNTLGVGFVIKSELAVWGEAAGAADNGSKQGWALTEMAVCGLCWVGKGCGMFPWWGDLGGVGGTALRRFERIWILDMSYSHCMTRIPSKSL